MNYTNQIIIPSYTTPHQIQPQTPTQTPTHPTTPCKIPTNHSLLPWKKTNSAFKKFRERKEKRTPQKSP